MQGIQLCPNELPHLPSPDVSAHIVVKPYNRRVELPDFPVGRPWKPSETITIAKQVFQDGPYTRTGYVACQPETGELSTKTELQSPFLVAMIKLDELKDVPESLINPSESVNLYFVHFDGSIGFNVNSHLAMDPNLSKGLAQDLADCSKPTHRANFMTSIDHGRPKLRKLVLTANELKVLQGDLVIISLALPKDVLLVRCHHEPDNRGTSNIGAISVFWNAGRSGIDCKIRAVKILFEDIRTLATWTAILAYNPPTISAYELHLTSPVKYKVWKPHTRSAVRRLKQEAQPVIPILKKEAQPDLPVSEYQLEVLQSDIATENPSRGGGVDLTDLRGVCTISYQ
jgi:hypothetical protein